LHEGVEIVSGNKADLGAAAGNRSERERLIADEAGQAEQGARARLDRHERFTVLSVHGDGGFTLGENVQAGRSVSLMEENTVLLTREGGGAFLERLKQVWVSKESRWIELHVQPFWGNESAVFPGEHEVHDCTLERSKFVMYVTYSWLTMEGVEPKELARVAC
jgi:hypothetical protein